MLKKDLIEKNKYLLQQNKDLLYLLNFGKLECEDSNNQMLWYQDSNAIALKQQLDLYKSVIDELENNWNELKKWLEEQKENFQFAGDFGEWNTNIEDLEMVLNKMQEIERDSNDN